MPNDLSKSIVTDKDFYEKYKAEVNKLPDNTAKAAIWKKDADWINSKKDIFSPEEFKTILDRNDDLAKRLAPSKLNESNRSKITLAGGKESVLVFNPTD